MHREQQHVTYDALSYCWDQPDFTRKIVINDFDFAITDNLIRALQRLRRTATIRYLRIDAICIDQANLAERSMQVRNMMNIFKKAEEVFV